eukprot:2920343-Amphidinium_carterae.1
MKRSANMNSCGNTVGWQVSRPTPSMAMDALLAAMVDEWERRAKSYSLLDSRVLKVVEKTLRVTTHTKHLYLKPNKPKGRVQQHKAIEPCPTNSNH